MLDSEEEAAVEVAVRQVRKIEELAEEAAVVVLDFLMV